MNLKPHATHILNLSRRMTDELIDAMKTDDDWFYQVHPKANHPLWIIGHLALADNMFASKFRPDVDSKPDGWEELFWFGTEPSSDRNKYPNPEEVLAYFRDRREVLLNVLDELTEAELNAAAPAADQRSAIAGAPNVGQMFIFTAYHEGMHTGQFTVAHRGLGHPPMYRPESVSSGTEGA